MLIGILADTHVPYRASNIPDSVLDVFRDVDLILHAGDVDEPLALKPLEIIAPVLAVSGNFHIFDKSSGGKQFPPSQKLSFCGFNIVMTHGHQMGWSTPFWRLFSLFSLVLGKMDAPLRDIFISKKLVTEYPKADILVFGHTHRYYTSMQNGKLVINPGAACSASYFREKTEKTVALMTLESGREPRVVRVDL